jgi:hypothetical protein
LIAGAAGPFHAASRSNTCAMRSLLMLKLLFLARSDVDPRRFASSTAC